MFACIKLPQEPYKNTKSPYLKPLLHVFRLTLQAQQSQLSISPLRKKKMAEAHTCQYKLPSSLKRLPGRYLVVVLDLDGHTSQEPYENTTSPRYAPNMLFAFYPSDSAIPAVYLTTLKEEGKDWNKYVSVQTVFGAFTRVVVVLHTNLTRTMRNHDLSQIRSKDALRLLHSGFSNNSGQSHHFGRGRWLEYIPFSTNCL